MDIEKTIEIASRAIMMALAGFILGTLGGIVVGLVVGASIGPFGYMQETAPDLEHLFMLEVMRTWLSWTPAGAFAGFVMGALSGAVSGGHIGGMTGVILSVLGTLQRWFKYRVEAGRSSSESPVVTILGFFHGPLGGALGGIFLGSLVGEFARQIADPMKSTFVLGFLGPEGGALIGLLLGLIVGPVFLRRVGKLSRRTIPTLTGMLLGVSIFGSIGLVSGAAAGWYFEQWWPKLLERLPSETVEAPSEKVRGWVGVVGGAICGLFIGGIDGIFLGALMGWVLGAWMAKTQVRLRPVWQGPPPELVHVARDHRAHGPYTPQQIRERLADGTIRIDDWAWSEGAPGWVGLYEVPFTDPPWLTQVESEMPDSEKIGSTEADSEPLTASTWRRALWAAAGTGFDSGVVAGALLGGIAGLQFLPGLLESVFFGVLVGGLAVAIGAVLVAAMLRVGADVVIDSPHLDLVAGVVVGAFVGGLGEQIYLLFGGELIIPFTGVFEQELVRAVTGAVVGLGVGWLVGRRLRRRQLLSHSPLLRAS